MSTRGQRTRRLVELGSAISHKEPPTVKHCRALLRGTGYWVARDAWIDVGPSDPLVHPSDHELTFASGRDWALGQVWRRLGLYALGDDDKITFTPSVLRRVLNEVKAEPLFEAPPETPARIRSHPTRPDTGNPDAWSGDRLWTWVFYISCVIMWAVVLFLIWRGPQ